MRPSSIPATIDIQQQIDAECGYVMGDATQVHQIIMNLCTNAFHAMDPQGGILDVVLRDIHLAHSMAEELRLAPGDYLRLTVSDTGTGIPEEARLKLFDPFFTTKDTGTGLGLSICKRIVEDHEGRIEVDSQAGKGTTFTVFLPLALSQSHQG